MDDWGAIRTFLAAVDAGSFSAAARRLRLSQSTVSRHVALLEASVGEPLFVRANRTVRLTEAGAALAGPASDVRDAIARLERIAAGRSTYGGLVRLATVDEIARALLVPALPALRAAHPELDLEIISRTETASLERRDADLALRFTLPTNASLVRRRLAVLEYSVYGTRKVLRDGAPWIGFEHALDALPESRWLAKHAGEGRIVFRATSIDAQAAACAAGIGLALLPISVANRHPALVARSSDVELARPIWLVAHRDVLAAARVRAVFRWVQAALGVDAGRVR